jgi:hypothetical protein
MDASEENAFNAHQHPWYQPRAACIATPRIGYRKGALTIDASELLDDKVTVIHRYNPN